MNQLPILTSELLSRVMRIINKSFASLLCLSLLFGGQIFAQGYIGEIINDTDEDIILECNFVNSKTSVIKSFILRDNTETQPRIQSRPDQIILASRTRNLLSGLVVPLVCPNFDNPQKLWESSVTLMFYGKKYRDPHFYGNKSCFIIRQRGDLLEFKSYGTILHELHLPDGSFLNSFQLTNQYATPLVTSEKIEPETVYSIEFSVKGALRAKIKRTAWLAANENSSIPKALMLKFIDSTSSQPLIKITLGFDKIVSNIFFNKFLDMLKKR